MALLDGDQVVAVALLTLHDKRIGRVDLVLAPDKLAWTHPAAATGQELPVRPARLPALAGAAGLAVAAGLHAAWATGSSWPAADRTRLADSVAGTPVMPDAAACWAVAATLAVAAGVTAGVGGQHRLAVLTRAGVASALLVRAATGLTGRTHLLVPWTPSQHFVHLDRRVYGPTCALLGSLTASSLLRPAQSRLISGLQHTTGPGMRCLWLDEVHLFGVVGSPGLGGLNPGQT